MNLEAYQFLIPRFWPDVVEIILVAFVIYRFLLFLVGTRAMQIVVGVMILSVAYFGALLAKFTMISALLSYVFTFGAFAAVVVFQPELRNALARLGQSRFMRRFSQSERQSVAEEIGEAMDRLSRAGTGSPTSRSVPDIAPRSVSPKRPMPRCWWCRKRPRRSPWRATGCCTAI